jgi:hypothetical protein
MSVRRKVEEADSEYLFIAKIENKLFALLDDDDPIH